MRLWPALILGLACTGNLGDAPGPGKSNEPGPLPPGPQIEPPPLAPFAPAEARLQRLTRKHYLATISELLGPNLELPTDLEVDTPLYGFSTVGAGQLSVGPRAAEQFETAALSLAQQVFADPARRQALVGCAPTTSTDTCIRNYLERFGRRAWRRPLAPDELDRWQDVVRQIDQQTRDLPLALELVTAGLLQSPYFLYRVELGQPESGRHRYTGYEMASRLSYFIWGTTPDDALLDAAAAGRLDTSESVAAETQRMLADRRARALLDFFEEHLKLDRLDAVTKDAATFPQLSPTLLASMRAEILATIESVALVQDADLRQILTTRATFINEDLARLYQLSGVSGAALVPYEHPANSPRAGILTTGGFLALNAHATLTSPTYRGRFVRQSLLCQEIPPPPPGVTTTLPEPEPGQAPQTLRQRLESLHLKQPTCAGCHLRMDPLGFAFESFDALGAYRTTDNGLPVDPRGELDGAPFQSAKGLAVLLAEHPDLAACMARMTYRYASGHLETPGEARVLASLTEQLAAADHRFLALVLAIVTSDGFRYAAEINP